MTQAPPPSGPGGPYPPSLQAEQAYAAAPANPPKRPSWPITIGVLSIIFSSMPLLCTPFGLLMQATGIGQNEVLTAFPDWYRTYSILAGLVGIALGVVELLAGITSLKRRAVTRTLHLTYGALAVCLGIVGTAVAVGMMDTVTELSGLPPQLQLTLRVSMIGGMVGSVFGLAYPVFLLIWFSRVKIRRQVDAWRFESLQANIYQPQQ